MSPDLGHFRENYDHATLRRADLAADPIEQFGRWFADWSADDRYDAAACVLATADADGRPSARFVLCREFDERGFVIYTNYESRKARDLATNPHAALVFGWLEINRQVRVEGPVTLVDEEQADAYWASRPRSSQIGGWASDQSEVLDDRAELEAHRREFEERFGTDATDGPVPRPQRWGGYRIGIESIEFWQGRPDRLHDRFRYRRSTTEPTGWDVDRLAP
jgi:pyridoxamine 5'-phosphate oxidase